MLVTGDRALRLALTSGWFRTQTPHHDFRLSLEFRASQGSAASLYVRTWLKVDGRGRPASRYEISLGSAPVLAGKLDAQGVGVRLEHFSRADALAPVDQWNRLVLECRGDRLVVFINDRLVTRAASMENSAGYLGLRGERGHVDVRDIVLTPLKRALRRPAGDVRQPEDAGVVPPKLIREVKPAYTRGAMEEGIEGAVLLSAVVLRDGTVGTVDVLRSLDAKHGLDAGAVAAVKRWRFEPAMADDEPVPVQVTVELDYRLK